MASFSSAENCKVAVIGAGYIGSVLSAVLAENGCEVVAVDIDTDIVRAINNGRGPVNEPGLDQLISKVVSAGRLVATSDMSVAADADVVLITVGTPLDDNYQADTSGIDSVVRKLGPFLKDGQLVIVKSTVPPFTTERHVDAPLKEFARVKVAFCPERLAEGNAIEECRSIPVVVGGVDEESTEAASEFWRRQMSVEVIKVGSARAAELVKLADNAWIDLNIALAFELAQVADAIDIDVLPVIAAANSLPKGKHNVNILTPSIGVGGYCLTKDPWFLNAFAGGYGFNFKTAVTSREVNDATPIYSARKINEALIRDLGGRSNADVKVAVLGLAFKNNTGDCRFTPVLPLLRELRSLSYQIEVFDPWLDQKSLDMFADFEIGDSVDQILNGATCVVFAAGHDDFRHIDGEYLRENFPTVRLIFDGRMFFSQAQLDSFQNASIKVIGVGR